MGTELCGCNNNPGPSSETSLVIILIYNKRVIQVPKKIETIKNNPKKSDIETNSNFRSINDNISISQNDLKSVNSQNNKYLRTNQDKEVSKNNFITNVVAESTKYKLQKLQYKTKINRQK